jgi:hypothetical protein
MERDQRAVGTLPDRPAPAPLTPAPATAADKVLDLQTSAGNRAVTDMVQSQGPDTGPMVTAVPMYPIFDRATKQTKMVDDAAYEQERQALARLIRYLAKEIPRDAKEILEGYPFAAVKEMYQEVTEALQHAGSYYSKGDLA